MITLHTLESTLQLAGEDLRNATVLDLKVIRPVLFGLFHVAHAIPRLFVEFYRRFLLHQVHVFVQAFQQIVEEFYTIKNTI